jgi:death-on-curing protein
VLIAGIALAYAFEDGNKRLAYVVGETFLLVNGVELMADSIAYADEVLGLVNRMGSLDDAQQRLADWLRGHGHKATQQRDKTEAGQL